MHVTENQIMEAIAAVVLVTTAVLTGIQQITIKAIQVRNAIKDAEEAKPVAAPVTVNVGTATEPPSLILPPQNGST